MRGVSGLIAMFSYCFFIANELRELAKPTKQNIACCASASHVYHVFRLSCCCVRCMAQLPCMYFPQKLQPTKYEYPVVSMWQTHHSAAVCSYDEYDLEQDCSTVTLWESEHSNIIFDTVSAFFSLFR